MSLIDVRGISKTFRSKFLLRPHEALSGLAMRVEEGEIFGFLGPNGAGKTTTIKILVGLIRPSAGEGHVLGKSFGDATARREIGFLPDSPNFYRYLSAREFLRFAGRLHGIRQDLDTKIESTLDRVGLVEGARDRALKTYSRGMLQRTGIAAAILHRPKLVILDEPMNGLDPLGRHDFRDLILSLKQEGVTVLLSSHVLSDIESTADRVGILHGGKLVREGRVEDILAVGERTEILFQWPGQVPAAELCEQVDNLTSTPLGWRGFVNNSHVAGQVMRRVLDAGGDVLELRRERMTLEEIFVETVSDSRPRPQSPKPHPSRPDSEEGTLESFLPTRGERSEMNA